MKIDYTHPDIAIAARKYASQFSFSPDTADDLAQGVRLKLWEIERDPNKELPTKTAWIYSTTIRMAVDITRKKTPLAVGDILSYMSHEETPAADEFVLAQERAEALAVAIDDLPETYRTALLLNKDGLSDVEAGKALGISTKAVGIRASRARTQLRANRTLAYLVA